MPDTEHDDAMAFLRYDGSVLHRSHPIQHHLGRQLKAMYDALPLPEDPQLDALVRRLGALQDTADEA